MSVGQGSITVAQKKEPAAAPAPPFALNSADNGLSVDPVTFEIVLGQAIGQAGDPAQLLSNREIPLANFAFHINNNGFDKLLIDPLLGSYQFGDPQGEGNGSALLIDDPTRRFFLSDSFANYFNIDAINLLSAWGFTAAGILLDDNVPKVSIGDFNGQNNGSALIIDDSTQILTYQSNVTFDPFLLLDPLGGDYLFGDINGVGNSGLIDVFDNGNRITASIGNLNPASWSLSKASELFTIRLAGGLQFVLDANNNIYRMGDINNLNGGLFMQLDDNTGELALTNAAVNSAVRINGTLGFTGTVAPPLTITVDGGIVTNVA